METPPNHNKLLTDRALQCAAVELGVNASDLQVMSVSGGFSRNRRALVSACDKTIFVKEVDVDLLPDDGERELAWLKKDYEVMRLLQKFTRNKTGWRRARADDNQLCVSRRLVVAVASGKICGRTIYFSSGGGGLRAGKNRSAT